MSFAIDQHDHDGILLICAPESQHAQGFALCHVFLLVLAGNVCRVRAIKAETGVVLGGLVVRRKGPVYLLRLRQTCTRL